MSDTLPPDSRSLPQLRAEFRKAVWARGAVWLRAVLDQAGVSRISDMSRGQLRAVLAGRPRVGEWFSPPARHG
jgi:hypothetical protein